LPRQAQQTVQVVFAVTPQGRLAAFEIDETRTLPAAIQRVVAHFLQDFADRVLLGVQRAMSAY
jgi:hypothetical protein